MRKRYRKKTKNKFSAKITFANVKQILRYSILNFRGKVYKNFLGIVKIGLALVQLCLLLGIVNKFLYNTNCVTIIFL